MTANSDINTRLTKIFFPHSIIREQELIASGNRLVHYTTASTAMEIIRNKEFWLRDPACMNDISEVEHGMNCIFEAYRDEPIGKTFRNALDDIFPGTSQEVAKFYDKFPYNPQYSSYIGCFSEHLTNSTEDLYGRLSMWRAYGDNAGVALILNPMAFQQKETSVNVYTSPVEYLEPSQFGPRLSVITENLKKEKEFLKNFTKHDLIGQVVNMLRFAALSTKHPGFAEEREWRLLYFPFTMASQNMKKIVCAIRGIPQEVYAIPLGGGAGEASGTELNALVEKVIIGPTEFPIPIASAFVHLLDKVGISNPQQKVIISRLPLRTK